MVVVGGGCEGWMMVVVVVMFVAVVVGGVLDRMGGSMGPCLSWFMEGGGGLQWFGPVAALIA